MRTFQRFKKELWCAVRTLQRLLEENLAKLMN
jgi:hypothetical protein